MALGTVLFEEWEAGQLQASEFPKAYDSLEPIYQVKSLRVKRRLTQKQLAEWEGTA